MKTQDILDKFFNGNSNIEDTIIQLENKRKELEEELKFIKDFKDEYFEQIAELKNTYPDGYNGYLFEVRNGSTRFSYKNISEWIEANKHLKDIESKYKQVFLSRQKGIMVASEDGEELELPEVDYGSGSVILRPIK